MSNSGFSLTIDSWDLSLGPAVRQKNSITGILAKQVLERRVDINYQAKGRIRLKTEKEVGILVGQPNCCLF